MYKIEVDHAPAYEFITSLYFYINKDRLKIYDLGVNWKKKVDEGLDVHFRELLKDKNLEVLHRIALLVHKCPGGRTPDNFIDWFKELSPQEIYHAMDPWVQNIPRDMIDLQQHLVYLFTEWNKQYFMHVDSHILKSLEQDANEKKNLLNKMSPIDLLEFSTNGVRIEAEHIQKVLLVPQYHYSPLSIIDYYKDYITCLYPIDFQQTSSFISNRAKHFYGCLSDDNRMLILKSLYGSQKTFKELLEITNLAKSNLHYHLAMLRSAGLIRAHHSRERVEGYSLRLKTLSIMQEKLFSYIRGNE